MSSKFNVQGSKLGLLALRILAASKHGLLKIAHEAADHLADGFRVSVHVVELLVGNITLVECYIELRSDFPARALGGGEELNKFLVTAALKSFGDIAHR